MDPDKPRTKSDEERQQQESATSLVRAKLDALYAQEPDAAEEASEVAAIPEQSMSRHQRYMKELTNSGRDPADVQTAWHEYYNSLDNAGKHEVWEEFYSEHAKAKQAAAEPTSEPEPTPEAQPQPQPQPVAAQAAQYPVSNNTAALSKRRRSSGTAADVREHLLSQIQSRATVTKNPHVRALAFGLGMGALTIFILLFGFFNERFITPFIRPSTNVSATPIIVDPDASGPVGPEAKIIIPKINVEAPVVYDVPSIKEEDVQKGLENGVVHYITTPNPGEKGNAVIFGHSSSNILNKGKYKFAFLLLKSLDKEDTFIVQKDGKRYVYKIYNKFVTTPTDLSVLGAAPADKPSIMTLITCDPPGTSTNRLIIQAEQIFPDPAVNATSSVQQTQAAQAPPQLPGNSVTMWQRIKNWF